MESGPPMLDTYSLRPARSIEPSAFERSSPRRSQSAARVQLSNTTFAHRTTLETGACSDIEPAMRTMAPE